MKKWPPLLCASAPPICGGSSVPFAAIDQVHSSSRIAISACKLFGRLPVWLVSEDGNIVAELIPKGLIAFENDDLDK